MKKTTRKIPGVAVADMDTRVRPQDDFYRYANGGWLKKNKIPPAESRWGSFTVLRYKAERGLKAIVASLVTQKRVAKGSPAQLVRDFYYSGMDTKTREQKGLSPLQPLFKKVESIKTKKDLLHCLAELHKVGISSPWSVGVDQDMKDSTRYVLYFCQSGLSLPDREYYLKNTPEFMRVRTAYRTHLEKMFSMLGSNASAKADTVLRLETRIAKVSMDKITLRNPEKTYYKKTPAQLSRLAPGISWRKYFADAGIPPVPYVVLMQPRFLQQIDKLFDTVSLREWQIYLTWQVLSEAAPYLTHKLATADFEFYGHVLAGSKKMKPLWRRALGTVNGSLPDALGKLYVEKHFDHKKKHKMDKLVSDLFVVYKERIEALDWMSPQTKRKAVQKLRAMVRKIGYPERWKSYHGLTIRPDDYFGNILRSSVFEQRREMKKLGKPIDRHEWFMSPQTVNAYFHPTMNEIVFPAAILQPPFFNFMADDAINYGAIGSVIGHEMTHGFDDQGAKFDSKGNLKGWWTPADKKRFEKRGRVLVTQYNAYSVADGVMVNGKLTLGENIADLGGLVIAYSAYQKHLEKTGRKTIGGFTPEQRFFLGFAAQEQELRTREFAKMAALNDPHSPAETRINGPLSNFAPFYQAYKLSRKDKLYRPPKERVHIW